MLREYTSSLQIILGAIITTINEYLNSCYLTRGFLALFLIG